jgi:hypothetical protein
VAVELRLDPQLEHVRASLSAAVWQARIAEAERRAAGFERVAEFVARGRSASAAIREVFPEAPLEGYRQVWRRFRDQGLCGLIDRRLPRNDKLTPEVAGFITGFVGSRPPVVSRQVVEAVDEKLGVKVGGSTVRGYLRQHGMAAPTGRPAGRVPRVEPLPMAGAELLKAVELEVGAVRALTGDMARHLLTLPAPADGARDDRAGRDERGRFTAAYNAPGPRRWSALGDRFESVELRREGKDLPGMRAAMTSEQILYRKNVAMTLLPLLAPAGRWEALANWKGDLLGPLCGFAYRPATLDKYLRELKYGGLAETARRSVARFWTRREGPYRHPVTGALVVYVDTVTKPVWTHHFTRSVPIARLGRRVMPGMSTVMLNSGYGTGLVYRTFSGHVSLAEQAKVLLAEYERVAGAGMARRLAVMDREAHSVANFQAFDASGWLYVVPLRTSVLGPRTRIEEPSEWEPYRGGDAVCSAWLELHDRRKGSKEARSYRVRVVGRRRARTDRVAWFATNADADGFSASALIDVYFERWPNQEHFFRDANQATSFDAHYGYGKRRITDVAIVDKLDHLAARDRRAAARGDALAVERQSLLDEASELQAVVARVEARVAELQDEVARHLAAGEARRADVAFDLVRRWESWLVPSRARVGRLREKAAVREAQGAAARATAVRAEEERAALARKVEVFAVDTELDQVLTAFKLTFLNLCACLLERYFDGLAVETATLIDAILTLPGERVVERRVETIRIWRQPRERRFMDAVGIACGKLTARKLVREKRTLVFEVVDRPET